MQLPADGIRARYKTAGVDVTEGERAVHRYQSLVQAIRPEVEAGIGGFYGAFRLDGGGTLVAGADGVGTKVLLAERLQRYDTVGIDLVAMNVNDILTAGAEPLFFLDYLAVGRLDADIAAQIVEGVDAGCREAGAALLGGETAEMPGVYGDGQWDLAGFVVGRILPDRVQAPLVAAGQVVLGLPSSGFHSNGFSLVRRILNDAKIDLHAPAAGGDSWGETLLTPTRIYVKPILSLVRQVPVSAMAHVTGGGLAANLERVLGGRGARLHRDTLAVPAAMEELRRLGGVSEEEMRQVWNAGIGYCLVLPAEAAGPAMERLAASGQEARPIGEIVDEAGVRFV